MKNKKLFAAGILIFIVVFCFDCFHFEQMAFQDNAPNFTLPFILRSVALFLSAYLLIVAFENKASKDLEKDSFLERKLNRVALAIGIVFMACSSYLLVFNNAVFDALAKEDSIIEYSSALLAFLSSAILLFSYFKFLRSSSNKNMLLKGSVLVIAFGLFLIAMEEISWFQRILDYKTPEAFMSNKQREFNLHNFQTNYVEGAYYFGAFIFFLCIPYLKINSFKFLINKRLEGLVPSRVVMIIGALSCTYTYDMWNIAFMQFAFYGSIVILWQISKKELHKRERLFLRFIIIFIILVQLIFVSFGTHYIRSWSITEYREFMIPFGFFIYALGLYASAKKHHIKPIV
ncbi:MAG: hypothetical protein COA50_03980 [Flavobacteriaceae bacterium]|nr:MAG: hypothetical protein COA50_03980 [Flavobacteriaceae bacterium]